ncbi:MAG: hypothetical protein WA981_03540 [Glaciecola sp.]
MQQGNPFYISPLGGMNVGQSVTNMGNQWKQNEMMDMQRTQFEQQQQQQAQAKKTQAQIKNLMPKAMQGDVAALQEIYTIDPSIGQKVREGAGIRDEAQAKQTSWWLQQYHAKAATDPKAAYDWLQQTAAKSPVDFDDKFLGMPQEEVHKQIMLATPAFFDKEQLAMLQGGGATKATTSQKDFQYYQQLQQRDPELAKQYGMAKGYVETGRDAAPTTAQRDWKEYQKLKKTNPEEARQYGQAAGFVSKEGRELSAGLQKRLSTATDEAVKAGSNVIKYNDLASQVDNADIQGGLAGQAGELLKKVTGQQDFRTELRKDYYAIRGSEVVNNLPPGAASDTDIALALAGFPDDSANGQQIASFLRGLSKINEYQKQYNEFKANYISENGTERNMLKAWKEQGVEFENPQRGDGDSNPLGLNLG